MTAYQPSIVAKPAEVRVMRRMLCAAWLAAASLHAFADLGIAELLPQPMPKADAARAAILTHPTLMPLEIEDAIEQALTAAAQVAEGPGLYARKMAVLSRLEPQLGPVREIPSPKLHFLLAAVADEQGGRADAAYHGAYAVALIRSIERGADGSSPAKAFKVVMIDEEYQLFRFHDIAVRGDQRVALDIDGRSYDVWTLKRRDGGEGKIYFDFTGNAQANERVLKARMEKKGEAGKK